MTSYPFGREFRLKILALCLDDGWMSRFGSSIIQANYFEQDDEEAFCQAVLVYREKFNESPDDPYDVIELMNGENSTFCLDIFEGRENWDLSLASELSVIFAQEQAAKLAILDSVDDVTVNGNIQAAIDRMKKALEVGKDLSNPGIDPIADVDQWLYDYWKDKVPTRLLHVDEVLEGGLGVEELGVILAPVNRGKSMTLLNIGYGAASIGSGKNVIHISHEMSEVLTAKRYAARLVFRFPRPNDNLNDYAEELVEKARRLLVGQIKIIGGAEKMDTHGFEAHINRLVDSGFEPGLIIDDYLDKLVPIRHYNEKRFELSDLYEWFRQLSPKYNCPVWTASQANRASFSKEIITMADVAEDIGKVAIADVVIALCQTNEEEANDKCRLFMAKVRDGANHDLIQAKYYKKQQAIVTTKIADPKEDDEDV